MFLFELQCFNRSKNRREERDQTGEAKRLARSKSTSLPSPQNITVNNGVIRRTLALAQYLQESSRPNPTNPTLLNPTQPNPTNPAQPNKARTCDATAPKRYMWALPLPPRAHHRLVEPKHKRELRHKNISKTCRALSVEIHHAHASSSRACSHSDGIPFQKKWKLPRATNNVAGARSTNENELPHTYISGITRGER